MLPVEGSPNIPTQSKPEALPEIEHYSSVDKLLIHKTDNPFAWICVTSQGSPRELRESSALAK